MVHYNITNMSLWALLLCSLLTFSSLTRAQENLKPLVVTSVKPLAIIAKSALKGQARVEYIMSPTQSPHDTVLRLSDIRKLAAADIVLWIGPNFEGRAAKHFASITQDKLLTAIDLLDFDYSDHLDLPEQVKNQDHHSHAMGVDPHIWLSPTLSNQLGEILMQRFNLPTRKILSPEHRKILQELLKPYSEASYLAHHDGLGYFVSEFNLKPALAIRDTQGHSQGAKTQFNLRVEGKRQGASCIFVEPQHGKKDAASLAKDLSLPLRVLDLLASDTQEKLIDYEAYFHAITLQFTACFK